MVCWTSICCTKWLHSCHISRLSLKESSMSRNFERSWNTKVHKHSFPGDNVFKLCILCILNWIVPIWNYQTKIWKNKTKSLVSINRIKDIFFLKTCIIFFKILNIVKDVKLGDYLDLRGTIVNHHFKCYNEREMDMLIVMC